MRFEESLRDVYAWSHPFEMFKEIDELLAKEISLRDAAKEDLQKIGSRLELFGNGVQRSLCEMRVYSHNRHISNLRSIL